MEESQTNESVSAVSSKDNATEVTEETKTSLTSTVEKRESTFGHEPSIVSETSGSSSSSSSIVTEDDQESSQQTEEVTIKKNPLDGNYYSNSTSYFHFILFLDLTYEELSKNVRELQTESKHLTTENDMFERYLTFNDPQLLEGKYFLNFIFFLME